MSSSGIRLARSKKAGAASHQVVPRQKSVGVAQAHLGISLADVWNMMMIEFQRAMEARYPLKEEGKEKGMPGEKGAQAVVFYMELFQ